MYITRRKYIFEINEIIKFKKEFEEKGEGEKVFVETLDL
jgi:hypothetical protein